MSPTDLMEAMLPLYENRTNSVKTASWVRRMGLPNGVSPALSVDNEAIFNVEIKWNGFSTVTGPHGSLGSEVHQRS